MIPCSEAKGTGAKKGWFASRDDDFIDRNGSVYYQPRYLTLGERRKKGKSKDLIDHNSPQDLNNESQMNNMSITIIIPS